MGRILDDAPAIESGVRPLGVVIFHISIQNFAQGLATQEQAVRQALVFDLPDELFCMVVHNLEVNKTKSKNSPTLKNSQKFIRWGQWVNTRSISEKVINFEITDFSMYGDFLPKIDANFS